MLSERIPIRFHPHSENISTFSVVLRELTGKDEMDIQGIDTNSSVEMLESLVKTKDEISVMDMCASDRDALLAAMHRQYWGDNIGSTLTCHKCDTQFDLSFKLSELQHHLLEKAVRWEVFPKLTAKSNDGQVVNIPDATQEIMCGEDKKIDSIIKFAKKIGIKQDDIETKCEELQEVAPIIDTELDAQCPECEQKQQAHFDIQSFVMKRLLDERDILLTEIHYLASNYGWTLTEILDMPRTVRKKLTKILDE